MVEKKRQEIIKFEVSAPSIPTPIENKITAIDVKPNSKILEEAFINHDLINRYKKYLPIWLKVSIKKTYTNLRNYIKTKKRELLFLKAYLIKSFSQRKLNSQEKKDVSRKALGEQIDVAMGILCHERPEYLRLCLNSLTLSELKGVKLSVYFIDDGSTNINVRQEILEFTEANKSRMHIEAHFFPKGENNAGQAINRYLKIVIAKGPYDFVGWTDPDAIFSKKWTEMFLIALEARRIYPSFNLGPISSFNSSNTEFHKPFKTLKTRYGSIVLKRQMGMLNYFLPWDIVPLFGEFTESPDDETLKTNDLEKANITNFCTNTSYVEHIGQDSILDKWRPVRQPRADYGLNLISNGWPPSMDKIDTVGALKNKGKCFVVEKFEIIDNSETDLMVMCHPDDIHKLVACVKSVKANLRHEIRTINIIAPNNEFIREICAENGYKFIDEAELIPTNLERFKSSTFRKWPYNWVKQQFIKLQLDQIGTSPYLYLIDVDTILNKPIKFINNNKLILLKSDEWHSPYFDFIKRIFPTLKISRSSFITHQMFLKREWLKELRKDLEFNTGFKWDDAILQNLDFTELNCFSEFELIGNWLLNSHPEEIEQAYWFGFQSEDKKRHEIWRLFSKGKREMVFSSNHNRRKWRNEIS